VILGVGIDVVDVERFAASLERTPALRAKLFTPGERERGIASLAARFAAKEALAKSLGAPRGLRWHDAEIVSQDDGRPELRVTGTIEALAADRGILAFHVSLSHDAGIASAVVIAEG
jgi:holo-[acyl-carrier protein] synthase